tara:strand:- start:210 stop:479 length:270 start_codon:yes stop_codon:yes gene_type:complete
MLLGLLKTLFYIYIGFHLFRLVSRILMPYLLKFFVKKAQRNFRQKFGQKQGQAPPKKEGEVSVDHSPNKKQKPTNSSVGEYVDFEEIDD